LKGEIMNCEYVQKYYGFPACIGRRGIAPVCRPHSPELLEALELVKASFSNDSHLRRSPAIWQMVNDAIAKAKH